MTEQENPNLYSPLTLAFLGDAVYELCARAYVVAQQNRPVGELHQQVVALVNAGAQSAALERLLPLLTPEELAIFKRGRNASASSVPKHAETGHYRQACHHRRLPPGHRSGGAVWLSLFKGRTSTPGDAVCKNERLAGVNGATEAWM